MNNVEISRPRITDIEELGKFFRIVIMDTFAREGLEEKLDDIENEIEEKKKYLKSDLDSSGQNKYFLIALSQNIIIGSIEYGLVSELIINCTDGQLAELVEIGTVFVHPNYQGQGIGNLLLNLMYLTLQNRGIKEFCLDSGYTNAQKIWKKKFGEPDYVIKDYWGVGYDHMIWRKSINEITIKFNL